MPYTGCYDGCYELFIQMDRLADMIWMIGSSIIAALIGLGLYVYFLQRGQFDDEEDVKYQIFREDNPDN